jgi:hypothetical protein
MPYGYDNKGIPARAAAVLLCVLLILFFAGCQPTPETTVVINKNSAPQPMGSASVAAGETYSAPAAWKDSFEFAGASVTVNIDADVFCREGVYRQYEITPLEFTQAQAEKLVEAFFKGAALEAAGQRWTKAQYEEFLIGFKAQYATGNEMGMSSEEYEASVKELERRLAAAPETAETLDPQQQIAAFSETGRLRLNADLGRTERASLDVANGDEGFASSVGFMSNDGDGYSAMSAAEEPDVSEDDAKAQAKELLAELGVDYMDVAAIETGVAIGGDEYDASDTTGKTLCRLVHFTRTVDGVPSTYDCREGDSRDSDEYERTWPYERITVGVDERGITQFAWEGNARVSMPGREVALLPFETVMERFEEGMKARYAFSEDGEARTYVIGSIALGLTRVKTKYGGYMLTPVWDFFGSVTAAGENGGTQVIDGEYESLLTINAADGSVIDRSVGY